MLYSYRLHWGNFIELDLKVPDTLKPLSDVLNLQQCDPLNIYQDHIKYPGPASYDKSGTKHVIYIPVYLERQGNGDPT